MKKRSAPEEVEPVCLGNTRYEAPLWGKNRGLGQNGGHIVAIDQSTGQELWVVCLYEIRYDPNMEEDKQDIFLTSLTVDAAGSRLLAEDERGRQFALDLFSRQVTTL
ncbi:hypothetical protein [Methylomonas albis]|uniref:Uncharacterized protein n=1 Tax=Methylomonas albis TaxID=1854563 RepID=A0ABR9D4K5_9GAMM|nr:hypothetical protein [Methylomonas albis]MBD9358062.1 hypothetical protein [Methylomonas albis]